MPSICTSFSKDLQEFTYIIMHWTVDCKAL